MPLQNFVDNNLPTVKAAWLNGVDVLYFTVFASAATVGQALTALGATATGTALFTAASAAAGRTTLGAAASGANSDITSLSAPALGAATATTAAAADSSTKVATTAFGQGEFVNKNTVRTANTVLAGPTTGGAAAPTFRTLVVADIPALTTGTLTAGTVCEINPIAVNSQQITAHGLGAAPKFCVLELVCLTGELGYTAGDVVEFLDNENTAGSCVITTLKGAVNVSLTISNNVLPAIARLDTKVLALVTGANWKLRSTPYRLN